MKSFLFSLTNGDKFNLINNDKAIFNHSSCGPLFGDGHDLIICDKANTNNSSGNINSAYKNEKYQYNNK